jgi:hypothetical protein
MNATDGGYAFPKSVIGYYNPDGVSLRDYFAAQAMTAIVMLGGSMTAIEIQAVGHATVKIQIATAAYQLADAMLKERQSK